MADVIQFTEEELNSIKGLKSNTDKIIFQLGNIQYQRLQLDKSENSLKESLKDIEKKEKQLAEGFTSKYGTGTLDIESGNFTPQS